MAGKMFAKLLTVGAAGALIGAAVVATAAPEFNTRGNRFKALTYAELTPDQRTFADREIAAGRSWIARGALFSRVAMRSGTLIAK